MAPPLPPGRRIELPGRGRTFVRELAGPPGAPTVLLLHGWTASADLNWFPSYAPLAERFRVLALDHRGHGRGIRSRRRFRLADCADDAAALLRELDTGPVTAIGYSMGGPVGMLLWRRHPELVDGLVLCATSATFSTRRDERVRFAALAAMAAASRAVPRVAARAAASRILGARNPSTAIESWIVEELQRSDWTAVLEAGMALGHFDARAWLGRIDVPAAVLLATRDLMVAPHRQIALARSIPDATLHPVQGDHSMCLTAARHFVRVLRDATEEVTRRSRQATSSRVGTAD